MYNSVKHKNHVHDHSHTNVFVDLNGAPYLLAEYLDHKEFQQIDRSLIKSEITIDQTDAMRAIIDISIDDIGKRASDGYPATFGNTTKQKKLLAAIERNADAMNHKFNVLRRGIIMRINYQLENSRTRQVIRSMVEDLRINDRNYFLDINPVDINDNGIVVNFSNTMVSTINQFTHGLDRMVLRITNIQMMYECVKDSNKMPRVKQTLCQNDNNRFVNNCNPNYYYHDQMQNRHIIAGDSNYPNDYYASIDCEGLVSPPCWSVFNRFYQFDNGGRDIILHGQEINDPYCETALIPCGTVAVNRAFIINPGHRLIFKFSIWKNDCVVIGDTTRVAQALRAPILDGCHHNHHDDHHHHDHLHPDHHPDYHDRIIKDIEELKEANKRQDTMMNSMMSLITSLQDLISTLHKNGCTNPDPDDTNCNCSCNVYHEEIDNKIEEIQNDVQNIEYNIDNIDGVEITPEEVGDIWEGRDIDPSTDVNIPDTDPTLNDLI